jgi:hypothetical protein
VRQRIGRVSGRHGCGIGLATQVQGELCLLHHAAEIPVRIVMIAHLMVELLAAQHGAHRFVLVMDELIHSFACTHRVPNLERWNAGLGKVE